MTPRALTLHLTLIIPEAIAALHEENRPDWTVAGRMSEVQRRAYEAWKGGA